MFAFVNHIKYFFIKYREFVSDVYDCNVIEKDSVKLNCNLLLDTDRIVDAQAL